MKQYGLNELRTMFLQYFEEKGHFKMDSFSLIPHNDKSLLLINSGMAPLKPYFTGQETPPSKRVTTCQKCIRTPDIENVGKTARHGTFFEMLGNFSFGDYFKKEAIAWAWDFMTNVIGIDESLLFVTVYEEDDEAYDIWNKDMGLDQTKIVRMGKKDNFWEIGVGPCGPCSEIYFDRGEAYGCDDENCYVGCECDRYVEVWNLVFTQFDRDEEGNYSKLKNPNIDTGMGLERLAVSVQGVDNLFEVDTVRYVLDYICELADVSYQKDAQQDVSIRVITDHIRSVTFMLSDGVIPSNEGRGYVLRRLLRRAVRHGKLLGIKGYFMSDVSKRVIETSKEAYPNLEDNKESILKIIDVEEVKFNETIAQGMDLIKQVIESAKNEKRSLISGEEAFKLYDTYGFPLELTIEIAEEEQLNVDLDGFDTAMKRQKQQSTNAHQSKEGEAWKDELTQIVSGMDATVFTGYDRLTDDSEVIALIASGAVVDTLQSNESGMMITQKTPFYAQSGGQVGDIGIFETAAASGQVTNVVKSGDKFIHQIEVESGVLNNGDAIKLIVDQEYRMNVQRNHTATHLLHKALKIVLGNHVNQAGSEVSADKLRFDFSHFEKMTEEEISRVEDIVNCEILSCKNISWSEMEIDQAKEMGATALFGEKYGQTVRVVQMGDFSTELCGGCHLENTGHTGLFRILSESGVAAGVRRIEAVTGQKAYEEVKRMQSDLNTASELVRTSPSLLHQKLQDIVDSNIRLHQELTQLKKESNKNIADELIAKADQINGTNVLVAYVDELDMNELRDLSDELRNKLDSGIVFLVSVKNTKGFMITSATSDLVSQGFHSGNFIKKVAQEMGSGGGGKADMAQAGLKDIQKASTAPEIAKKYLVEMFG